MPLCTQSLIIALSVWLWTARVTTHAALSPATNHWAFQPLVQRPLPIPKDRARVRHPVDAFVLAPLDAAGLKLSPAAPAPALLRRLSFDLTGLPPSVEQVRRQPLPADELIDSLLASPHFGERWARWWLDAAAYVDTVTLDNDPVNFKEAREKWRYRDYVIAAFNEDQPFDQFLREQLAGDAMSSWRDAERLGEQIGRAHV